MNNAQITAIVDRISVLAASVAELEAEKRALTDSIKALGDGKYWGTAHYLTVATSSRSTLDMDAVRAKLSTQFITAHTRVVESTTATLRGYNAAAKAA